MGFMHIRSRGAEREMLIPRTKTEDEGRGFHWIKHVCSIQGASDPTFHIISNFQVFFS